VLLWVGPLLDCASIFLILPKITWSAVIATFVSGFYVNVSQAICTAAIMLLLGSALLEKLDRVKMKYGMMEDEDGI